MSLQEEKEIEARIATERRTGAALKTVQESSLKEKIAKIRKAEARKLKRRSVSSKSSKSSRSNSDASD